MGFSEDRVVASSNPRFEASGETGAKIHAMEALESAADEVLINPDRAVTLDEKLATCCVKRSCLCYGLSWGFIVLISMVVFAAGWGEIDEFGNNDFLVLGDDAAVDFIALSVARELVDEQNGELATVTAQARTELSFFTGIRFLVDYSGSDNTDPIINPVTLQKLCEVQQIIYEHPDYPRVCPTLDPNGTDTVCSDSVSDLVAKFYDQVERETCDLIDDPTFDTKFNTLLASPLLAGFFVTPEFLDGGALLRTRSEINLPTPLGADSFDDPAAYLALDNDEREQAEEDLYKEFLVDIFDALHERFGREDSFFRSAFSAGAVDLGSGLELRYYNVLIENDEVGKLVNGDLLFAIASILFVSTALFVYLRSIFWMWNGMLAVIMSIPSALFLYTGILGIPMFGQLQLLVLFVIIGLGADALLIYVAAWEASSAKWRSLRGVQAPSEMAKANLYNTDSAHTEILVARVVYTWRTAGLSILYTSLTTIIAFMATALSPLAPIAAFGIYAGCVMVVNLLFSFWLFPLMALVSVEYFQGKPFCCACFRSRKDTSALPVDQVEGQAHHDPAKDSILYKFFDRVYLPIVQRKWREQYVVVWGLVTFFAAIVAFMFSESAKLDTPADPVESYREDHMFATFEADYNGFSGGDDFTDVSLVWGIQSLDQSEFNRFEPNGFLGTVEFDDAFDLAPSTAQAELLDVCDDIANVTCVPPGSSSALPGCIDPLGRLFPAEGVECVLRDFHEWHAINYPGDPATAINLGDVNASLWLDRLEEFSFATDNTFNVGILDGELKFFVMVARSSLRPFQPVQVKEPVLDLIDAWYNQALDNVITIPGLGFYQTNIDAVFIVTERAIVDGLFNGLIITLPAGFLVLLVTSKDWVLSTLAILTIGATVGCVLGVANLIGFSLGVAEGIAGVIAVGLSIDFPLHESHSMRLAKKIGLTTTVERFNFASLYMSPTLTAGWITTAGSVAVLFGTQLQFFYKLGLLLVLTISSAWLLTMFWFMPSLLVFLPNSSFLEDRLCKRK